MLSVCKEGSWKLYRQGSHVVGGTCERALCTAEWMAEVVEGVSLF